MKHNLGDTVLVRGSRNGTIVKVNPVLKELTVAIWKEPKEIIHIKLDVFEQSLNDREGGHADDKFIEEIHRLEESIPSLRLTYSIEEAPRKDRSHICP